MKILLLGSTGGTGLEIARQALEYHLELTTVVRSPDKLGDLRDRIDVVTGSAFDADTLRSAADGCDAALSTVGAPAGFLGRGTTTVYSKTAAALVAALPSVGVTRLVFCTSAGVEPDDPHEALPYRLIAKPLLLQRAYDDMTVAESVIIRSGLDWTLVRPGRLTNKPGTGHFTVSPRFRAAGGTGIPRADVAAFMLDQLTDPRWVHATPTLTA